MPTAGIWPYGDGDAMTDGASLLEAALAKLKLQPIVNALGQAAEVVLRDGIMTLAAPVGRLVVAPGQSIASAWGNATFDQTIMCFNSTADRDNQYPAPHEGSECFTNDTKTVWRYANGAWRVASSMC